MYYLNNNPHPLPSPRELTVTGNGKVNAKASYVQVQLEVITKGEDVSKPQQENAIIMNRVIQSILELNIPREDIQTVAYNIAPIYEYIEGKQIFKGYEVSNAINVKIKDISQVGTVIDTAVENGTNRVSAIQFQIENADLYYQQALSVALQNAQMKAATIAKTMQLNLHPQPIEIVEENAGGPVLYKSVAMAEQNISTPIEQGQMTIHATVRVKYQY
ncbi:SIMPL domain-containing protein [Solibacillus sp. CAU 1738]|uniref:SIMPL domain-containing protein n=1 Tax=Solibacillus sp. CAU 1738 TaxID=3140363 RepID=UPI003260D738